MRAGAGCLLAADSASCSARVRWGGVPGNHQGGANGFTRPVQIQISPYGGEVSTQEGWCRFADCMGGGLNTGTVPSALTLKPHNSASPCMSLAPPELPSIHLPEPRVRESVLGPFKRMSKFSAGFRLTWTVRILCFSQPDVVKAPLLGTGALVGSPMCIWDLSLL